MSMGIFFHKAHS